MCALECDGYKQVSERSNAKYRQPIEHGNTERKAKPAYEPACILLSCIVQPLRLMIMSKLISPVVRPQELSEHIFCNCIVYALSAR